mgnify:CR=1 FL=1
MKKDSKIAIVAGGTGGHIFPAISLLEQLISEKKEIIFFSDKRVKNIVNVLDYTTRTTLSTTGHFASKKVTGVKWQGGKISDGFTFSGVSTISQSKSLFGC